MYADDHLGTREYEDAKEGIDVCRLVLLEIRRGQKLRFFRERENVAHHMSGTNARVTPTNSPLIP